MKTKFRNKELVEIVKAQKEFERDKYIDSTMMCMACGFVFRSSSEYSNKECPACYNKEVVCTTFVL